MTKATKNLRDIHLMMHQDLTYEHERDIYRGLEATLMVAGVREHISILEMLWRNRPVLRKGKRYATIMDWILEQAEAESVKPGYLNADTVVDCLKTEPDYGEVYRAVVVAKPLYAKRTSGLIDLVGIARPGVGFVMTTNSSDPFLTSIHEQAHVFGLIFSPTRPEGTFVDYDDYGRHCTNTCVMKLGGEEKVKTKKALYKRPFCKECERDLMANFV